MYVEYVVGWCTVAQRDRTVQSTRMGCRIIYPYQYFSGGTLIESESSQQRGMYICVYVRVCMHQPTNFHLMCHVVQKSRSPPLMIIP